MNRLALSFLMGMVTTIAAYSLRTEPASTLVAPPEPVATSTVEQPAEPREEVPVPAMSRVDASVVDLLRSRDLKIPVEGVEPENLRNTFSEARGSHAHEALDIIAPRGTNVVAVEDGRIEKLFTSKAGGLTVYQFDPAEMFSYYYAHLDRYADGLREGQTVQRGELIGYVGSTGNASPGAPHLHFAIFRLGAERQWWKGDPINPYPVFRER